MVAVDGSTGRDVGSVDVLVVGAGPAGAATAVACRRLGLSVAMVHRPAGGPGGGPGARTVEHVPSSVRQPLMDLGLWDAFAAADHTPCAAAYTAWGTDDLGWNILRDAVLVGVSLDVVLPGVTVRSASGALGNNKSSHIGSPHVLDLAEPGTIYPLEDRIQWNSR